MRTLIILLTLSFSVQAEIYTWTDENGVTHFSSDRPVDGRTSEEITVQNPNAGTLINDRQKKISRELELDRKLEEANSIIRKARSRMAEEESSTCQYYRLRLEDEEERLDTLVRTGYKPYEKRNLEQSISDYERRVEGHCP